MHVEYTWDLVEFNSPTKFSLGFQTRVNQGRWNDDDDVSAMCWSHFLCHSSKSSKICPHPFHSFSIAKAYTIAPHMTKPYLRYNKYFLIISQAVSTWHDALCPYEWNIEEKDGSFLASPEIKDELEKMLVCIIIHLLANVYRGSKQYHTIRTHP